MLGTHWASNWQRAMHVCAHHTRKDGSCCSRWHLNSNCPLGLRQWLSLNPHGQKVCTVGLSNFTPLHATSFRAYPLYRPPTASPKAHP